jgi:hypothetical protein
METKFHGNGIMEIIDDNVVIKDSDDVPDDIFSLLYINDCSTIIIKQENIVADFFDLSTRIAGEILQKFSTYHVRMAIVGDYSNIRSKSLIDFIRESNRTKQILFVETVAEALEIFRLTI